MNIRKRITRTAVGIFVAAACVAPLPAHAAETRASRQESIGVASGFTVGALAGGPIGALLGAATGAWLGDRYHRQAVEIASVEGELDDSYAERTKLRSALLESRENSERLAQRLEKRGELETQVSFRTGDADLPAGASEQLRQIGALVSTMPDMRIRVSGHADPRGTHEENDALSQKRAAAVAGVLAGAGIAGSHLIVEARGETAATAAEGDLDGYALDRRVVVRVERVKDGAVASN